MIATLIIFLILITVHEFGHFIVAKKLGVKVEKFALGFGPTVLRKEKGGTEYSIKLVPLGGFVKLAGDNLEEYKGEPEEFLSKKPLHRAAIIFFGPLLNYVLGILLFWLIFCVGYPALTTKIGGLVEGLGAKEAGIQLGDKIISVDGKEVKFWDELQGLVHSKSADSIARILVLRENKEQEIAIKIKTKEYTDILGRKRSVGLLGITPSDEIINIKYGFFKSFRLGITKTWELTVLTYAGLWRLICGKLSMRESITGPLGIFYITSKTANLGINAILHLMALLSTSLAIFNLLPLPVLDGGHIFLLFIEKIRGKTLNIKQERIISQIGISLIVSLVIFATYNDIVRFFGDSISKFFR